jgi:hypothetical protein
MEHNARVDEGNEEQDTTTRLESITIRNCIQNLLKDSVKEKREPTKGLSHGLANSH